MAQIGFWSRVRVGWGKEAQRHKGAREPGKQRSSTYINNTKKGSCCSPRIFQPKATAAMFGRELEQKLFAKSDLVKGRIKY
ncbi:hypothetical protein MHYP_G00198430 [Metynnis hypsauchen]